MSSPTVVASPPKARKGRRVIRKTRDPAVRCDDDPEYVIDPAKEELEREEDRRYQEKWLNEQRNKRAKPAPDPSACVRVGCPHTEFDIDTRRATRVCTFCGAVQNAFSLCYDHIFPQGEPQMPAM